MNYILFLILFIFVFTLVENKEPIDLNICGKDWIPYKNEKCFKVVNKLGTEEEAKIICTQMDKKATLISIGSKEEQIFVEKALSKYNNVSEKVWMGMNIHELALKSWDSEFVFTNWAEGSADLIGYNSCVQMSLSKITLGKWSDEPCRRRALIACQKRPEWTLNALADIIKDLVKTVDLSKLEEHMREQNEVNQRLQKEVNKQQKLIIEQNMTISLVNRTVEILSNKITKNLSLNTNLTPIPIGFIYIQLPNQLEPSIMWPKQHWLNITAQYSGLFFRAEGKNSLPFGEIQKANNSRITNIMSAALVDVEYHKVQGRQYVLSEGWSPNLVPAKALSDFYIHISEGENRPKNTAIRVWKRVG